MCLAATEKCCSDLPEREPAARAAVSWKFIWNLPVLWNRSLTEQPWSWVSSASTGNSHFFTTGNLYTEACYPILPPISFLSQGSDLCHYLKPFPTYPCFLSSFSFTSVTANKSLGFLTRSWHLLPGRTNQPTVQSHLFFWEVTHLFLI